MCEILNGFSAEVKALSAKFEGSEYVDSSITSMSSVPLFYSIIPYASVEIKDPASFEDVTNNVSEFIYDTKSDKFYET